MNSIFSRQAGITMLTLVLSLFSYRMALTETASAENARDYFERALTAHQQKDNAGFVRNMEMALKLRPTNQVYMYDLAGGYALAGRKRDALSLLSEAAGMGYTYPNTEQDPDFASLHGSMEFDAVLKHLADNQKPIVHSETAFVVHEKGLVPEGLAYDPDTKTFYLGSVYQRKIISVSETGETREFSNEADGLWSVMGMKVDARRRCLWACTAGHPQMANAKPEDNGKTAIVKYDLTTGKLTKKYPIPADEKKHWLGDLTLDSNGNVYASDSLSPAIYVIRPGKDEIGLLCAGAPFINPQGLAVTQDERHLLMADYLKGLFLVDLETKKIVDLAFPPHVTLLGIDGIYSTKNEIIAVQNGVTPNRVVRIQLNKNWREIEKFEVLESNSPLFDEPTLGVIANNEFYFIANSQWGSIDPHGQLAPSQKLHDPIILKLKL